MYVPGGSNKGWLSYNNNEEIRGRAADERQRMERKVPDLLLRGMNVYHYQGGGGWSVGMQGVDCCEGGPCLRRELAEEGTIKNR